MVFEALRPSLPADGLLLLDSTTGKAQRAASSAAGSTAAAEALSRSRGGLCSKLHACADGAGWVLWLIASLGTGTHMAAELFQAEAGVRLTHVPYQGSARR